MAPKVPNGPGAKRTTSGNSVAANLKAFASSGLAPKGFNKGLATAIGKPKAKPKAKPKPRARKAPESMQQDFNSLERTAL